MGPSAQYYIYNTWLLWNSHIPRDAFERLDHVNKLDISNHGQLLELYQYFRYHMNTISFWLTFILLPSETAQHLQSIQRTPWHLCNNPYSEIRGFSGTNDTRYLLPPHVRQESFDCNSLSERKSSSGKMFDLLLTKTKYYRTIPPYLEGVSQQWKKVLILAVRADTHALIDTGALLTGICNVDAANFLLSLSSFPFLGVVYFDLKIKSWMMKSTKRRIWPLRVSPISPEQCFT